MTRARTATIQVKPLDRINGVCASSAHEEQLDLIGL